MYIYICTHKCNSPVELTLSNPVNAVLVLPLCARIIFMPDCLEVSMAVLRDYHVTDWLFAWPNKWQDDTICPTIPHLMHLYWHWHGKLANHNTYWQKNRQKSVHWKWMWDTNKHTENKKVASTIILAASERCEQAYYKWVAWKKFLDAKERHDQM